MSNISTESNPYSGAQAASPSHYASAGAAIVRPFHEGELRAAQAGGESQTVEKLVAEANEQGYKPDLVQRIEERILELFQIGQHPARLTSARASLHLFTNLSSAHYSEQKKTTLSLLIQLLEQDPILETTSHGVVELAILLSKQIASSMSQRENLSFQIALTRTYHCAIELILRHYAKKNLGGITKDLKEELLAADKVLKGLNTHQDIQLSFALNASHEGVKRLTDDSDKFGEALDRLSHVGKGLKALYQEKDLVEFFGQLHTAVKGMGEKIKMDWYTNLFIIKGIAASARSQIDDLYKILAMLSEMKSESEKPKHNWKFAFGALEVLGRIAAEEGNTPELRKAALCGVNWGQKKLPGIVDFVDFTEFQKHVRIRVMEKDIQADRSIRYQAIRILEKLYGESWDKDIRTVAKKLLKERAKIEKDDLVNTILLSSRSVEKTVTFSNHHLKEYQGRVRGERITGKGKLIYSHGVIYEGFLVNSKPHGQGRLIEVNGDVYQGTFEKGVKQGRGCFISFTKDVCEGEFRNDQLNRGKIIYTNGDIYEGDLENYLPNGQGRKVYAAGNEYSTFEGTFVKGKTQGRGKLTYANGDVYEGECENSLQHGQGSISYANGNVYIGIFVNGQQGPGKLTYRNGNIYEGPLMNGSPFGRERWSTQTVIDMRELLRMVKEKVKVG